MNKTVKNLILITTLVGVFFVLRSILSKESETYDDYNKDIVLINADGKIPKRQTLDQAWDKKTQEEFWFTSQGSEIMPYNWFTWLEQPKNSKLFRNAKHMEFLGYLPQETSNLNPSGLPIGFTITRHRKDKERSLGLTCAACHTNQINYKNTKLLIDGAPSLSNFVKFYDSLADALVNTLHKKQKFNRFAKNVLQNHYSSDSASELKTALKELTKNIIDRQNVNALPDSYPKDFTGHGRIDAFGNISNAGTAFALEDLNNKNTPNAPVSIPFLWGSHQSDVVQWNASAPNKSIGPLVRNVGEVVGVFGKLDIDEAPWWKKIFGFKVDYSSSVDYKGLGKLELLVKNLRSPEWPEELITDIDLKKERKGKIIYDQKCKTCHEVIPRDKEGFRYTANQTLVSKLGTDPLTAQNAKSNLAKSLDLEGTKKDILIGARFIKKDTAIQVSVNGVIGLILKNPIQAIRANNVSAKQKGKKLKQIEHDLDELEDELETSITNHLKNRASINEKTDPLVYKGRPLNGIWATAPYLHNGSVPNLWELLQTPENRIKTFHVGSMEFDPVNVGFITDKGPSVFNVLKENSNEIMPGNSNLGHSYGTELSDEDKWTLIEYLKSL